jgi:putative copper export protein
MNSIAFFFHLVGMGILFAAITGGWILERRIRVEKDLDNKLLITKINRRFNLLFLIAATILLLTGIINILNIYGSHVNILGTAGWLIAKIILFAFLIVNGTIFGPTLIRRRTKSIQNALDKPNSEDAANNIKILNKGIATFDLVQFIILIFLLFLSIIGGDRHSVIINQMVG